jgi:hypothetical protein
MVADVLSIPWKIGVQLATSTTLASAGASIDVAVTAARAMTPIRNTALILGILLRLSRGSEIIMGRDDRHAWENERRGKVCPRNDLQRA